MLCTLKGVSPAVSHATYAAICADCLQEKLSVSTGGVGLYTPDPEGAPQVFYLGHVAPPSSFYKPARKVGVSYWMCCATSHAAHGQLLQPIADVGQQQLCLHVWHDAQTSPRCHATCCAANLHSCCVLPSSCTLPGMILLLLSCRQATWLLPLYLPPFWLPTP